jgi:hypothetical protein
VSKITPAPVQETRNNQQYVVAQHEQTCLAGLPPAQGPCCAKFGPPSFKRTLSDHNGKRTFFPFVLPPFSLALFRRGFPNNFGHTTEAGIV